MHHSYSQNALQYIFWPFVFGDPTVKITAALLQRETLKVTFKLPLKTFFLDPMGFFLDVVMRSFLISLKTR